MAANKIDFGRLGIKDYVFGVVFVLVGMVIAYGLINWLVPGAPQALLSAIGAAIGVAAWFSYLRKRND
jgi:hypothetical protein